VLTYPPDHRASSGNINCTTIENDIGVVLPLSWNPIPLENDQSSCHEIDKSEFECFNPLFLSLIKNICL
jgi:hypothetical protein